MHAVVSEVQHQCCSEGGGLLQMCSLQGELENIKHAEERAQTDAEGQERQWVFQSGWPPRLSGLRSKAGVTRPESKEGEGEKREKSVKDTS